MPILYSLSGIIGDAAVDHVTARADEFFEEAKIWTRSLSIIVNFLRDSWFVDVED